MPVPIDLEIYLSRPEAHAYAVELRANAWETRPCYEAVEAGRLMQIAHA